MTAPTLVRPQAAAPRATGDPLCVSYIGARVGRVTRLDSCGRPVYGEKSQVVFKGFVSAELDWETEDGEDYTTKAADGSACITGQGPSIIKWATVSLEFCRVDPDLLQIMNPTWEPIVDYQGRSSGVEIGQDLSDSVGFALELWPKAANAGNACLTAGQGDDWQVNGYLLLPWCLGTAPESVTFEDAAVTFTLNARTNAGSLWGRGPYNVTHDENGDPAPLPRPFDPGFDVPDWDFTSTGNPKHVWLDVVDLAPPKPTCGATELYDANATAPNVSATANADDAAKADFEVSNWNNLDPKGGTVSWGEDGLGTTNLPASGNGKVTSPAYTTSGKKTITFTPRNGAKPVETSFTPTLPESGNRTEPVAADDPSTIRLTLENPPSGQMTVDWGDGATEGITGAGPHRHTYTADGDYNVVVYDLVGEVVVAHAVTVPLA